MKPLRLATLWLDGCSGCHMSLLDLDEGLFDLAGAVELVYGPLVDAKLFPQEVDVTLIEGAVSHESAIGELAHIRGRTRLLVAFGDCAVTANVPGMRNPFGLTEVLRRAYGNSDPAGHPPDTGLPRLLERVRPVHECVQVDLFLPGCPPPSAAILNVLQALINGQPAHAAALSRFGA